MVKPFISIIIDTYNQERFIERALRSVLEQDSPPADREIIVVDDGSTDHTPEILKRFEGRMRIIRKPNGGQASAFNAAIPKTRADIIAFLDGDDWWAPGKLRRVLETFAANPGIAAVGHGFYEVLDDAPPAEMFVPDMTRCLNLASVEAARVADLGRTLLGTSRLAVKRSVLERIGPIPSALVFCADTPILTFALALGGAIVVDEPLCYYRIHDSSLFTLRDANPERVRAKLATQRFLLDYLPARLAEFGVSPEIIDALFESDRVELARHEAAFGERGRLEVARTELREFRKFSTSAGPGYSAFRAFAAVAALVVSPARYQQLRDWYSRKNLKRFRDKLAPMQTTPAESFFQRRPVPRPD
jgi:hypothetical protein